MAKRRIRRPSAIHGVSTLSRSKIFVHRNRSGRARPDPVARSRHHASIPPASSFNRPSPFPGTGFTVMGASIKDLRARRVFSPTCISSDTSSSPRKKNEMLVDDGTERRDIIEGKVGADHGAVVAYVVIEKSEEREEGVNEITPTDNQNAVGIDEDRMQSTQLNNQISMEIESVNGDRTEGAPQDIQYSMEDESMSEDRIAETLPENQNSMEAESVTEDRTTLAAIESGVATKIEQAHPTRTRPAFTRCSRSKLYRNPSSFSYRRLLPFLMNIEKDNSDGELVVSSNASVVKVNNFVEEAKSSPVREQFSKDNFLVGSLERPIPVESSGSFDVDENKINASPERSSPRQVLHDWKVLTNGLHIRSDLDYDEVKSDSCTDDPILETMLLHKTYCSPPSFLKELSESELAGNERALASLPRMPEFRCSMLGSKLEVEWKSPETPPLENLLYLERHGLVPRRGILKKRTRGCKGICMCLDCVSFRIHADRAFNFSRKQMEEADEIIFGLTKELSGLRNLILKYIIPNDSAGDCAPLQLNQVLMREACLRASRAEEKAYNRCKQMFNDLNIHCKIPGPRVSFAESVEKG